MSKADQQTAAESMEQVDYFTCIDGGDHQWIPDGGCKVCRKCGFSPCS